MQVRIRRIIVPCSDVNPSHQKKKKTNVIIEFITSFGFSILHKILYFHESSTLAHCKANTVKHINCWDINVIAMIKTPCYTKTQYRMRSYPEFWASFVFHWEALFFQWNLWRHLYSTCEKNRKVFEASSNHTDNAVTMFWLNVTENG